MKKEYEAPIFEFCRIIFCEDILTASELSPTNSEVPEDTRFDGSDNWEESDPFDF